MWTQSSYIICGVKCPLGVNTVNVKEGKNARFVFRVFSKWVSREHLVQRTILFGPEEIALEEISLCKSHTIPTANFFGCVDWNCATSEICKNSLDLVLTTKEEQKESFIRWKLFRTKRESFIRWFDWRRSTLTDELRQNRYFYRTRGAKPDSHVVHFIKYLAFGSGHPVFLKTFQKKGWRSQLFNICLCWILVGKHWRSPSGTILRECFCDESLFLNIPQKDLHHNFSLNSHFFQIFSPFPAQKRNFIGGPDLSHHQKRQR